MKPLGTSIAIVTLAIVTTSVITCNVARASGVQVALTPTQVIVSPGGEFDVRIVVTDSGPEFNAYHAVIAYDPQVLTFVDRPASEQEGSDMLAACGNTFHVFVHDEGRLDVSHSLLCPGLSLSGPDELYVLRFIASTEVQQTQLQFAEITFADAGYSVPTEDVRGASVHIGNPTDVGGARQGAKLDLRVAPNPFNSTTTLFVENAASSVQGIAIHDSRGRLIRSIQLGSFGVGNRSFSWDARDHAGEPLASGIYVLTLRAGDEVVTTRAVLLK